MSDDTKKKKKKNPPEVNTELYELAVKIIEKYPEKFGEITSENFTVISVFGKANNRMMGKCRPVRSPYSALLGDLCYIIEVNYDRLEAEEAFDDSELKGIKMLLYHELSHIHPEGCDPDSKHYRKTTKHDVEDFVDCLQIAGNEGPYHWFDESVPDILA